jgi:hypothetical protein
VSTPFVFNAEDAEGAENAEKDKRLVEKQPHRKEEPPFRQFYLSITA